ncbi:SDR family NAD(P)-dependent oxidoreductase [Streptomyces sp. NPDC002143]
MAIVTGAAQGLGFATAELLAGEGAAVMMTDITADKLAAAAKRLTAEGHEVAAHAADLRQETEVASLVAAAIEQYGQIDVLVNMASIYSFIPFEQQTLEYWHEVMAANVDSTFLCAREVLPHMRSRNYGRIVNIASGTLQNPEPGLSAYVTSKGAIVGLTRQLSREAGEGITVNVVLPGLIATEHVLTMFDDDTATDAFFEKVVGGQAVKRRGLPADIAQCIAYVAGRDAGFVTGQMFDVGGGATFH